MKLWDIVKNVGATALNIAIPGSGTAIVSLVNSFLPDDKKLNESATGLDVQNAISGMDPADRALVLNREFDVQITQIQEQSKTLQAMLQADQMSAHTTRPYIAKNSFRVVALCTVITVLMWSYGIIWGKVDVITSVTNGWPFVLSVIGPLVALLYAYFGILKTEHKNRLNSIAGNQQPGVLSSIISAIRK